MMESGVTIASVTGQDTVDVGSPRLAANLKQVELLQNHYTLPEHLLYGSAGVVVGAVDTLLSSMGPLDDNTMENWAREHAGRAGQYFVQNRSTVGAIGDIAMSFVPATLGMRAVRTTGLIGRAATKLFGTRATPFLSTGLSNSALAQAAADRAVFLAQNSRGLNLALDGKYNMLRKQAMKRSAADVLIEGVAADVAIAATMNESDFLFPDEMTFMNNVAFVGGFNALFGGISAAGARWTLNKTVMNAVAPLVSKSVNPSGLPLINAVQNVEGQRWNAATLYAYAAEDADNLFAKAVERGDTEAQETIGSLQTSYRDRLRSVIQQLGQDAPFPGFTRSSGFSQGGEEIRTMQRVLKNDPGAVAQIASLEKFYPGAVEEITDIAQAQINKLQGSLERKRAALRELLDKRPTEKRQEVIAKIRAAGIEQKKQLDRLSALQFVVYDIDGTVASGVSRAPIWHDGDRLIKREFGMSALDVDGRRFEVTTGGEIRVDSTVPPASGGPILSIDEMEEIYEWTNKNSGAYFNALGVKNAEELEARLRQGLPATFDDNFAANEMGATFRKQVRNQLKSLGHEGVEEITLYGSSANATVVRHDARAGMSVPINVRVSELVGVDELGQFLRSTSRTQRLSPQRYALLSHKEKTAVLDGLQHSLEHVRLDSKNGFEGTLTKSSHWTQLDFVQELFERNKGRERELQDFVEGFEEFGSMEALEFASLRSKFFDFQHMRREAAAMQAQYARDHVYSDLENVSRALNLPMHSRGPHPLVRFFEGIQRPDSGAPIDFGDLFSNMDEVHGALKAAYEMGDDYVPSITRGTMLNMPRDARPVVGIGNNEQTLFGIKREDVVTQNAAEYAGLMDRLREAQNPLVQSLMAEMDGAKDVLTAAKTGLVELVEGARSSGWIFDNLAQQAFKTRGLPGVREVDVLAEITNRRNTKYIEEFLNSTAPATEGKLLLSDSYQQAFNKLLERNNQGDLTLWATAVNSLRFGWEVMPEKFAVQEGGRTGYRLRLRNSETNRRLWARLNPNVDFPEPDMAFVPVLGTNKPVTLTDTAMDALTATHEIDRAMLEAENAVLRAKGMRPHTYKPWHVPAKAFNDQARVFLLDHTGHVHQVIGGTTEEQARALAQQEIATRKKNAAARGTALELRIVNDADMRRYHDSYARAYHDMDDYSRVVNQTGPGTGRQVGEIVETGPRFLQSMLEGQLRQFSDIGRRVRLAVMDPELRYLRTMEAAAGITGKGDNVFSLAAQQLQGIPGLKADSHVGRFHSTVEHLYDSFFEGVSNAVSHVRGSERPRASIEREYQQMGEKLGREWAPYSSLEQFIENTMEVKLPPTLRRHGPALNEITAALTIRIADLGMAAVNMLSLGATLPPVVKMLQRLPDETAEQHLKRIGAWGGVSPDGTGYFQSGRAAVDGLMFMSSAEGRKVREWAVKKGYFDQYAAEQVEIYARTGESFLPGLLRSASNILSKPTDMTEIWARMIPFMTFYRIGKEGLKLSDDAAGIFAHQHANSTIADFRPSNRPYIFQGATGLPLGLFTTFMWNYLQRTFHMLETRQIGALMQQMGLQQLLFGSESLPLWEEYTTAFAETWDGDYKISDRMNEAFGHNTASFILNGSVSHFLSMNVNQRAAIGLPAQLTNPGVDSVPGLRLVGRGIEAMGRAIDAVKTEGTVNPARMAEIVGAANFNKALSNAIEIGQGYALDTRMGIVESDTRTLLGAASRAIGFKPLATAELQEENRRQAVTERLRSDRKKILGQTLRALARQNALTPDTVDNALEQYVKAGGNAENFKRYYMSQVMKGTRNKLDLEIAEALRQNFDQHRIGRLLFLMDN